MANHLVCGRHPFQLFRDILSELMHHSAAIGAVGVRGKMGDNFSRKIFRKRPA
jgi:hypothetical protein